MSGHSASGPVHLLTSRLDSVVKSGCGWRARCPACGGASRKLSIAEAASGAVLLRCFASCNVSDIVHAIGLQVSHLFPTRARPGTPAEREANRRAMAEVGLRAAIAVLGKESAVVAIAAGMVSRGEPLSLDDEERLGQAMALIDDARTVFRGR